MKVIYKGGMFDYLTKNKIYEVLDIRYFKSHGYCYRIEDDEGMPFGWYSSNHFINLRKLKLNLLK